MCPPRPVQGPKASMKGTAEESRDELMSALSGGAFFRCEADGGRLLGDSQALADCLGLPVQVLQDQLGAILGREAPEVYREAFDPGSDTSTSFSLPYLHPQLGRRWLSLRRSPTAEGEGCLVFLRDETVLHESMVKLSSAQSRDVENSARLQAAVLMEGARHAIPSLDYQTTTIPSKLVDGDFLDVLRLSGSSVDFLLGDVMGKGMGAAILGAMIKFSFARALSSSLFGVDALPEPSAICHAADNAVAGRLLERHSFATLTYARYDEEALSLRFVDCGHTSIIHHSARTGECWRIKGGNMPMGFMEGQAYRDFLLPVEVGDSLLLYTDGLSECCNRWDEALGEERVAYLLRTYSGLPASELAGMILRIGFAYSAAGFNDDVSLIVIKVKAEAEAAREAEAKARVHEGFLAVELESERYAGFDAADEALGRDLDSWIPDLGLGPRSEILLALHEALTNILEHGLAGGRGACELRWRWHAGLLSIEYSYTGQDYDWASRPVSPLARFADSGYGRLIMERATDSLLVSQGFHDRKRLVMCRAVPGRRDQSP